MEKKLICWVIVTMLTVSVGQIYAEGEAPPGNTTIQATDVGVQTGQSMEVSLIGGGDATAIGKGGEADVDVVTNVGAVANISTTSISKGRQPHTPPIPTFPPYLPYWTHGGWGTLKAYFPNGPSNNDEVYERKFDPSNPKDMRDFKSVLNAIKSYDGPWELLGSILNVGKLILGGPNHLHRGKGFEIANSLIRDRRPGGKPLIVFIDSNVNRESIKKGGYVYVGRVGIEGKVKRNWDQCYAAVIAETLPWDVDVLLVSGGMKGVTVGSNVSFPLGGGAHTQIDFSLSLLGGISSGIVEGKGKPLVSAEGYRHWPEALERREIPESFSGVFRPKPKLEPAEDENGKVGQPKNNNNKKKALEVETRPLILP